MKWYLLPILVTVAMFAGCSKSVSTPTSGRKPSMRETFLYEKVITKLDCPYEMSMAEKEAFFDKFKTLRSQESSYEEIVKLLGPPHTQIYHARNGIPIEEISVTYYLKKLGDRTIESDQSVTLDFDMDKKLAYVYFRNVESFSQQITGLPATRISWEEEN